MIDVTMRAHQAHMHRPLSVTGHENAVSEVVPYSTLVMKDADASFYLYLPLGVATVMAEDYAESMFELEKPVEQPDPADEDYDDWNTRRMENEVGDGE
jgi:hypothetical protein